MKKKNKGVMVLELICWRVLCGFKDILRGKSNEVRCVAVKGQAVRMEKESHWVRVIMRKQRQF